MKIKNLNEADADFLLTPGREITLQNAIPINTKFRVNMKAFLSQNRDFKAITGRDLQLRIVVADDYYFSLETFKFVFKKLGISDYCHFYSNGQEVIDDCKTRIET